MNSLTIAMPTTNSAAVIGETLNRAVDALANAGVGDVQLHIVDDDSDDRTTEIAREHALDHEWVADTIRYAIENPEMLLAPVLLVAIAWLIVSPVKQYGNNEDCEVEG